MLIHTVAERMLEREENEQREKGTEEIKTWRDIPGEAAAGSTGTRGKKEREATRKGPRDNAPGPVCAAKAA